MDPVPRALDRPPLTRPQSRRARVAAGLGALVGYLLLGAALVGQPLRHPLHWTQGGGHGDGTLFLWFIAHTAHAVFHDGGHGLLVTHDLNAPAGVNAMWNGGMLLPSLVLAPLTEAFGPVVTMNLFWWLGPPLSAWAAYLCAGRFGWGWPARTVTGLVFGFSPAVMAAETGHFHLTVLVFVPPILLLGLDCATGHGSALRSGGLLGLVMACQLYTGEEVLVLTTVALAVVLVVLAVQQRTLALRRLLPCAGWALLVLALLTGYPLWVQFFGPQRVHGNLQPLDLIDLDPVQLVVPTHQVLLYSQHLADLLHPWRITVSERYGYLGLPLLLLLVVLAVRWRRDPVVRTASLTGAVLLVLACGYTLHLAGHATGVPLPWRATKGLPVIGPLLPGRWMLVADLMVAVVVGRYVDRLPRPPRQRAVAVLLLVLALLPVFPRHLNHSAPVEVPALFTSGRLHGTVLVVPFPTSHGADAMTWTAVGGTRFAIPGGYFVGPDESGRAVFGPRPLRRTVQGLLLARHLADPGVTTPGQRVQFQRDLAYWGADTVVLGPSADHDAQLALLTSLIGRPPEDIGGAQVWEHVRQQP